MYFHLSWMFLTNLVACLQLRDTWNEIHNSINFSRAKMAPFPPGHSTIDVATFLALGAILNLDSVEQLLTFTATVVIRWTDPSLSWNKSLHNGRIDIEPHQVWLPQITLFNAVSDAHLFSTRSFIMSLRHDGSFRAYSSDMFKTICVTDAFQFPFDEQQCRLIFTTHHDYINLNIIPEPSYEYGPLMKKESEWTLIQMTSEESSLNDLDLKLVTLTLKRQSLFYVLSIIIPMALTSFMNAFVFILPTDSGEKISFLVSIFVSHAVFLNFVYDIMPRTSTRVPKIMIYLICILLQSFLALLAVTTTLRIRNNQLQGDHKRVSTVAVETEGDNSTVMSKVKGRFHNLDTQKLDNIFFGVFLLVAIFNTVVFVA